MPNIYLNKTQIDLILNIISNYEDIMVEGEMTSEIIDNQSEQLTEIEEKLRKSLHQKKSKWTNKECKDYIEQEYERIINERKNRDE